MKAKTKFLMALPLLSMMLAGCIAHNDENDPDVISIAISPDAVETDTMNQFIKSYKSIPGNENKKFKIVKMAPSPQNYIYKSFLKNGVADIIQVWDYSCEYYTNADLDGKGTTLLQPISSYMKRDGIKEEDFYSSVIEMTKCGKAGDENMYWVPRDYNKVVCAYNKEIFRLAGIEVPQEGWTWSEFVEKCEALGAQSVKEAVRPYSGSNIFYPVDLNPNFPAVYYPILKSYGANLIDIETGTCFGDTADKITVAKNAWGKLLSLADQKLASAVTSTQTPFTSKQAAMMFIVRPNLPTYVEGLKGGTKENPTYDAIDFVSLPTYEDLPAGKTSYVGMGCTGYGITTSCPDAKKEAAWDFLKFVVSEQGQNAFSESGAGVPSLRTLAEKDDAVFKRYLVTDTYHPNHEAFIAHEERDIPMNFMKGFKVEKQLEIDTYIKNNTLHAFADATRRDAAFTTYKTNMEALWR